MRCYSPDGSGGYDYVYQYKDHLGNVRLSYQDNSGILEILEENNYYPFGLKHKGYNFNINSTNIALKRKFGGKELQDDDVNGNKLDWYDFGARNYDASLGRWMNLDPLAETSRRFSPYTYALNNPVYFIDPDGMQAIASPGPQPLALTYNNPDAAGFSFNGAGGTGFNFDIGSTHFSSSNTQSSSDPKKNSSTKYKEFFIQKSEELEEMIDNPLDLASTNDGSSSTYTLPGLSFKTPLGIGFILTGTRFNFLKPLGALGSSPGSTFASSTLSYHFRGNIYDLYGKNKITDYLVKKTITTNVGRIVGRLASRFVPWVGWALITNDLYDFGKYIYNDTQRVINTDYGGDVEAFSHDLRNLLKNAHEVCFVAGTKISMADGSLKDIKDIKVGDHVKTYNEKFNKIEDNEVLKMDSPIHNDLIKISFDNFVNNVNTKDHPYYVKGKGWCSFSPIETEKRYDIKVDRLEQNDICYFLDHNKLIEIKITKIEETDREERTYNLSGVRNNHNFFANGILVHNKKNE